MNLQNLTELFFLEALLQAKDDEEVDRLHDLYMDIVTERH